MANVQHGLLDPNLGSGIHTAIGWPPFADDAARLAQPLLPSDVGKIALVEDTGRTWMLVRYSPARWVEWIDGGVLDVALDGKADDSDIAGLQAQINTKADAAATSAALALKADKSYVDAELAKKASQTDLTNLTSTVALKADKSYVDGQLVLKADKSALDALAATTASDAELAALAAEVATKADQADLDAKADAAAVSAALATKANQADLTALQNTVTLKADKSYVDSQLATKADTTWVNAQLATKADASAVSQKADKSYVDTELSKKADKTYVDSELAMVDLRIDQVEADLDAAELNVSAKVTGPTGATDNALARYDATTGKLIQNSGALLDDSNNLSGIGNITLSGTVDGVDVSTLATTVSGHTTQLATTVQGPATSPDNAIARYDGTTGKVLQAGVDSPTIDDAGNILLASGKTVDGYDVSALGATVGAHATELPKKVEGPAASTANAIARYADAGGKLVKNSPVTIDDAGNIATPGTVDGVDVSALSTTVTNLSATVAGNTNAIVDLVAGPKPAASTDNAIVRWDGAGGRTSQSSLVTIDDAGNISLPAGATVDGVDISAMGDASGKADLHFSVVSFATASLTLALAHAGKLIVCTNAAGGQLVIPRDSTLNLPNGFTCTALLGLYGGVKLEVVSEVMTGTYGTPARNAAAFSDQSAAPYKTWGGPYVSMTLIKLGPDAWLVSGNSL